MPSAKSAAIAARAPRNALFAAIADRVREKYAAQLAERWIAARLKTMATQLAWLAQMEPYIQRLRKTMERNYKGMIDEVLGKLGKWPKTERARRAQLTKDGFDVDAYLFSTQKWHDTVAQDIRNHTAAPLTDGGSLAVDELGLGTSFDQTDPRVIAWLAQNSKNAAFNITNTQYEALRSVLMEAQTEGWNVNRIRNALAERLEISRRRALLIARTEVLKSSNKGGYLGYLQSGVVEGVQWEAAIDKRTCPMCAEMDGKTMPLGKPFFEQGSSFTFHGTEDIPAPKGTIEYNFDYEEIQHPPLHPDCRCTLIAITREV